MEQGKSIKIYPLYYQAGKEITDDPIYEPILAGKKRSQQSSRLHGDDSGDNISEKNNHFSELTGIYWIWKNTKQDITGICHYRRFFTEKQEPLPYKLKRSIYWFAGLSKKRHGLIYTSNVNLFTDKILQQKQIAEILEEYDAILPQHRKLKYTVKEHYCRYHNAKDLKILEDIIANYYPDYKKDLNTVLNQKRMYANNMFILKEKEYKEFMEWWFDVLFKFEEEIDLKNYTGYQERIMGFIAERLLNVWFCHKKLKVKELQLIYFKKMKKT